MEFANKKIDDLSTEFGKYPVLNQEEETNLFEKYLNLNDLDAKNKLIMSNGRLALHICKLFRDGNLDSKDLVQVSMLGLQEAVETFDYKRGVKFSTYAYSYIQWFIKKQMLLTNNKYKLTKKDEEEVEKLIEAKNFLTNIHGRAPTEKELVEYFNDINFDIKKIRQIEYKFYSIFTKNEQIEELDKLQITELGEFNLKDSLKHQVNKELLLEAINKLELREKDIVQRKFGMNGYEPQTLEVIGRIYNLSKERIRQILAKALFKIERKLVKSIN